MNVDPSFAAGIHHLTVAKQYATASWVMAIYEYIITFDREVESIWQRKYSFATVLWVLNRYTLLLSYCAITLAFYLPFTTEMFDIISNATTGVTLSLRVYALYGRTWKVFSILIPTFVAEMVIESWAVASGVPVPIPPGQVGCILTGKATQGNRFAAFWIGQLIFPSMVFLLTFVRGLVMKRRGSVQDGITLLLLRDGAMYFTVIFGVNLANVLTYVLAPPDIQAINAPFSALITAMMICRLMLNLRDVTVGASKSEANPGPYAQLQSHISETFVGNLGEPLDIGDGWETVDPDGSHGRDENQSYELDTIK